MFPLALLLVPLAESEVQSLFAKVGPNPLVVGRTPGQTRAVVLLHGLSLHLLSRDKIVQARLRTWQMPNSALVQSLGKQADVFAFAYGQTVAVERVTQKTPLFRLVKQLKTDGYTEIVLMGHSAGGLIARQLVEDHPDCGVTRVVQINAPNAGSAWAVIQVARETQTAFFQSLSTASREKWLASRKEKRLPEGVQFACVVGKRGLHGDGVVSCRSQWTEDLQEQGIPAFPLALGHREALLTARGIELLTQLAVSPLPRWDSAKVAAVRKQLLGR
jgi:pimeloyl-ACP methyl ester carboxylesterase